MTTAGHVTRQPIATLESELADHGRSRKFLSTGWKHNLPFLPWQEHTSDNRSNFGHPEWYTRPPPLIPGRVTVFGRANHPEPPAGQLGLLPVAQNGMILLDFAVGSCFSNVFCIKSRETKIAECMQCDYLGLTVSLLKMLLINKGKFRKEIFCISKQSL